MKRAWLTATHWAQGSQELLYPLPLVSDDGPRCVCDQAVACWAGSLLCLWAGAGVLSQARPPSRCTPVPESKSEEAFSETQGASRRPALSPTEA